MKYLLFCWIMACFGISSAFAQKQRVSESDYQNTAVEMADLMRSNGKIYVVIAVIIVIFIGIGLYLFRLDRKISELEK